MTPIHAIEGEAMVNANSLDYFSSNGIQLRLGVYGVSSRRDLPRVSCDPWMDVLSNMHVT